MAKNHCPTIGLRPRSSVSIMLLSLPSVIVVSVGNCQGQCKLSPEARAFYMKLTLAVTNAFLTKFSSKPRIIKWAI